VNSRGNSTIGANRVLRNLVFGGDGAQLLEFALVLPLLLAISVGIMDCGQAYNLKQKLNNASREGARFAAAENSGAGLSTSDVSAVRDVVQNYLTGAGITKCTIVANPAVSGFVYTFTSSSGGCGSFSLVINRGYTYAAGSNTLVGTNVVLTYPYTWTINNVIGLMVPNASLALPATISTNSIMQNLN
jgi:Flp pilus assembly protein TadG